MSYFVVNKQLDYDRGFLSGGVYRNRRLSVSGDGENCARFVSRLFDSGTGETEWGRFTLDARSDAGAGLQIAFYTSESPMFLYRNRNVRIQELISDPRISADEKKTIFAPLFRKRFVGARDILLNGIRGRYLFFILDLYRQETENSCGDMCLYFPKTSWLQYLPAVYSRDPESADFTERFLGIFQSIYEDRERSIRNSAEMLNPLSCGRAMLEELGRWHDLTDIYLWPDEKLAELIRQAPSLHKKRGTIGGLKDYLRLYLGTEPLVREDEKDPSLVIVSAPERYLTDIREYRLLLQIIRHVLPVGMEARVTPLPDSGEQEAAVAIGVNSILGGAESADADGRLSPGIILEDSREAEK